MGFIQVDLAWVVAFQSLGDWLVGPMKFFSTLGTEEFYLVLMPFLYWCVDAGLGVRLSVILLFSGSMNAILKIPYRGPRPYWVSTAVKPLWAETSFGIPSGHAQQAVAIWGFAAGSIRRGWAWVVAIVLMLLIGLSRAFLGAHFFLDILAGWLIGGLLLWGFLRFWEPLAARIRPLATGKKILYALLLSLGFVLLGALFVAGVSDFRMPASWLENALRAGDELPEPLALSGILTSAGTLFGMLSGLAWLDSRGGWQASGPWIKRIVRYLVGILGLLVIWYGLGTVFPRGETLWPFVLRFIRYGLLGIWVAAGAPLFFRATRLA